MDEALGDSMKIFVWCASLQIKNRSWSVDPRSYPWSLPRNRPHTLGIRHAFPMADLSPDTGQSSLSSQLAKKIPERSMMGGISPSAKDFMRFN